MEAKAKTRCTLSTTARHCRRRGRRECPVSARKQKQTQNVDSEMARQTKQGTHSPCCELIKCKYATREFLFDATMPEHRRPATKTRKTKNRQSAGRRKALAHQPASVASAFSRVPPRIDGKGVQSAGDQRQRQTGATVCLKIAAPE